MLFPLRAGQVRVRGRVRVTITMRTINIFCLKTLEFEITAKTSWSRFLLILERRL